jgi:DeoR/GlpR family transcriptional regulator of sugar metabolism
MLKKAQEAENLRRELKSTLKSFPRAKTDKLAVLFKTTTRTIARHLKALQESGELKRVGSRKTGWWQVVEKETEQ